MRDNCSLSLNGWNIPTATWNFFLEKLLCLEDQNEVWYFSVAKKVPEIWLDIKKKILQKLYFVKIDEFFNRNTKTKESQNLYIGISGYISGNL